MVAAVDFPPDPLALEDRDGQPICLRDWWQGCAAFLVLGGPSLNDLPLDVFGQRGVLSFGVNNASGHVRTTAFTASDPPEKFTHSIWYDPTCIKFCPKTKRGRSKGKLRIRTPEGGFRRSDLCTRDMPSILFFERSATFTPDTFFTDSAATWGNNDKGVARTRRMKFLFTPLLALRLLHYLGVREVFAVGMDFSMPRGNGYAFAQHTGEGTCRGNANKYKEANHELAALKPEMDRRGFAVYNCLQRSGCNVFPFVPFETALERVRGLVEAKPQLDLWYESKGCYGETREEIRQCIAAKQETEG